MNFADAMNRKITGKLTENGAFAYNSLNDSTMELFAQIGALRPRSEDEIEKKFLTSYRNYPALTTKMLFYAGNIRGGLGERRTFRICLRALAFVNPKVVEDNIQNIPYYNRFDSLFELIGTPAEDSMWDYVSAVLSNDRQNMKKNKPVSLLAKWLPSEKAHSAKTLKIYHRAIKELALSPREYRKIVSALRKYIDVTECKMSANEWEEINYSEVPSGAMKNYASAFCEHDEDRFSKYVNGVRTGKEKINASTLFPYDLVKNYMGYSYAENPVAEEQWKALPNYIEGENNIVVMADVSGSMSGRPMETSVGMAIYFAERNKGAYANKYMTFTDSPSFIGINPGETLSEKVAKVRRTGIGYSTNLEAAFMEILKVARANRVSPEEMPKALVVISDMEIDWYMRGKGLDFVEEMKSRFNNYGYELPRLVLWNVEARNDTYLSQSDEVIMVSGQSPSVFKNFIGALNGETREDIMIRTLSDPMYDRVNTSHC